jgi:hypothetical protein
MKTNFFRATAMSVEVLFAGGVAAQNNESINADTTTVGAQQVSNQIKKGEVHYDFVGTVREAYDYLKDNVADTIVTAPVAVYSDTTVMVQGEAMSIFEGDTLFVHLRYCLDGPRSIRRDTLWIVNAHEKEEIPVMSALEKKVARLAKETAVVDKVNEGRDRDRYGYRVSFDNGNTYTITEQAKDKWGVFGGIYAGGQIASGMGGFLAGGEAGYSWSWGVAYASLGIGYNKYTDNATTENANRKMTSLDFRAGGGPMFNFGKWKQWSIGPVGGIGEMSFKTDSREVANPDGSVDLMQSEGNGWYWWAGARGTYRGFNNIGSMSLELTYSKVPNVVQNEGQIGKGSFNLKVSFDFDFFRGLVNNHK